MALPKSYQRLKKIVSPAISVNALAATDKFFFPVCILTVGKDRIGLGFEYVGKSKNVYLLNSSGKYLAPYSGSLPAPGGHLA